MINIFIFFTFSKFMRISFHIIVYNTQQFQFIFIREWHFLLNFYLSLFYIRKIITDPEICIGIIKNSFNKGYTTQKTNLFMATDGLNEK
jgi:hypothetical protein